MLRHQPISSTPSSSQMASGIAPAATEAESLVLPLALEEFRIWQSQQYPDFPRISQTLTPSLWSLKEEDALYLTEPIRRALRRYLRRACTRSRNPIIATRTEAEMDFCAAVIKALTVAADERALPLIRTIAKASAPTPESEFVRGVAQECERILTERLAEQKPVAEKLKRLLAPKPGRSFESLKQSVEALPEREMPTIFSNMLQARSQAHLQQYQRVFFLPLFIVTGQTLGGWVYLGELTLPNFMFIYITLLMSTLFSLILFLFGRYHLRPDAQETDNLYLILAQYKDSRFAPRLIDTMLWDRSPVLVFALSNLLGLLQSGDEALFSPRHRTYLRQALSAHVRRRKTIHSPDLLPLLHALTILKDKQALPLIDQLLRQPTIDLKTRQAAEDCRSRLQEI